ncbi:MAG: hypothetical protein OT477_14715 [Chloroflexi bacterium]|nr:hypothetical protein [Chloroflexota bacterium]
MSNFPKTLTQKELAEILWQALLEADPSLRKLAHEYANATREGRESAYLDGQIVVFVALLDIPFKEISELTDHKPWKKREGGA